jgi:preprotein translocase subunit SecE
MAVRRVRPDRLLPALPQKEETMAKTTPGEFVRQVRNEANKIVWPTPRETMMTAIMVLIMTTILAIFFLGIDSAFGALVRWLLSFAG